VVEEHHDASDAAEGVELVEIGACGGHRAENLKPFCGSDVERGEINPVEFFLLFPVPGWHSFPIMKTEFSYSIKSFPRPAAFTLIELLVVISIIAILAALALPAMNGAIQTARKGEVRAMANQIKAALTTYYAEYGIYPTGTNTDANFVLMMTTNSTNNRRGVRFLEIPSKFSNASGLVTPLKFFKTGQSNFSFVCDTDYNGQISVPTAPAGGATTNINASVAVWVADPFQTNKVIGTW
jgi:prepilin-type N-terminal cleavage/methylation domain-containing protein